MNDVTKDLLEALRPFVRATITSEGNIIGLMRDDFERARAAFASAESATVEPLIVPEANESVNQRLLEALRANHQWHIDNDDYDGYPGSDLEVMNLAAIARAEAALTTTQPDAEVAK